MDTTRVGDTRFLHNGDLKEETVEIVNQQGRLLVSFDDLAEFVAGHARDKRIAKLKDATTDELLGI